MWSYQAQAPLLWEESIAQVRSYLLHCSISKMVNFRDPNVMDKESGAHAPQPFFSKSEGNWTHLPERSDKFWSLMNGIFVYVWLLLAFSHFDVSYNSILPGTARAALPLAVGSS
jgi:hypothetical protein